MSIAVENSNPTIPSNSIQRWVKTYCPYCGVGCGLLAGVSNGVVAKIKGDNDHPSSLGDLCLKAIYLPETLKHRRSAALPADSRMFRWPVQTRDLGPKHGLFGAKVPRDY